MKKNLLGMTLIEVVLSMWIFGIVVISVMSLSIGGINKHNQSRIQAVSILRSEFERCRMKAEVGISDDGGSITGVKGHAAVVILKDSSKEYYNDSSINQNQILKNSYHRIQYMEDNDYYGDTIRKEYDNINNMDAYTFQKYMFSKVLSKYPNLNLETLMKEEHGFKPYLVTMEITDGSTNDPSSYYSTSKDAFITIFFIDYDSKGNIKKNSVSMKGNIVTDRSISN